LGTLGLVCGVLVFLKGSPTFIQRFEKKYGRDENNAIPRCLMAAKFIGAMDVTGERTLCHWVAQGQIQDLHQAFIS
jgi:hypothetical protein